MKDRRAMIKEVAELYGFEITECEPGEGGFYVGDKKIDFWNGLNEDYFKAAEREGRLHIAPIANGTPIWYFAEDEEGITNIYESTYLYGVCEYHIGELGENVFLTQEEAEKAFAERR